MENKDIKIVSLIAIKRTLIFILNKKNEDRVGSEVFKHNTLSSYGCDKILGHTDIFNFDSHVISNLPLILSGFRNLSTTQLYEYIHIGSDVTVLNGHILDHVNTKQLEGVIELLSSKIEDIQNLRTLETTDDTMADIHGMIPTKLTKEEDAKVLESLHLNKQSRASILVDKRDIPQISKTDIYENVEHIKNKRPLYDNRYLVARCTPTHSNQDQLILDSILHINQLMTKIKDTIVQKQQITGYCIAPEMDRIDVQETRFDLNRNHRVYSDNSRGMTNPIIYFEDEGSDQSDPFMDDEFSGNRLVKEWEEHGKLIIAYDFDNTVFDYYNKGYKYNKVINLLKRCKKIGAYFIVSTCCDSSKLDEIKEFLTKNEIPFDSINENAPFIPFQERKIYYNVLLDDRAGLRSAYLQLSHACDVMEGLKEN